MTKTIYYVSVATGIIEQKQAMEESANLTHEFVVEATDAEISY